MNADHDHVGEVHMHEDQGHGGEVHAHGGETHSHGGHSHQHGAEVHTHGEETHSHGDHSHEHDAEVHTHGGETHSHGGHSHQHAEEVHSHAVPSQARLAAAPGLPKGGRVLYVDCFAGASGDMLLGALIDVGLPLDALEAALSRLDLAGYRLVAERIVSHGLTGTQFRVDDVPAEGASAFPARHLGDIRRIVEGSTLSDPVKARSMAVIERLGRAEAGIHGVSLDEVHFHEIGAVDTIVDVVGFVAGLELLGVGQVYASAVPLGSGSIWTAHGRLPAPAPATLALLASVGAPTVPHPAQTEIVTPTGAALLCELATFERPAMRVMGAGYGFGQKTFPWANGLRVWLGESEEGPRGRGQGAAFREGPRGQGQGAALGESPRGQGQGAALEEAPRERGQGAKELPSTRDLRLWESEVVEFECNLDDTTGEMLGYTMERLLEAGALDVWFTPIQMKKNRPGVLLSVLAAADAARVEALAGIVLRETSTLGVRLFPPAHRFKAERRVREVATPWGAVRVKEKWLEGVCVAASPEYEDCARLARESGEPIVRIMNAAREGAE